MAAGSDRSPGFSLSSAAAAKGWGSLPGTVAEPVPLVDGVKQRSSKTSWEGGSRTLSIQIKFKKEKKKGIAVFLALKPESTMVDHTSHPSSPGAVSAGSPLQPGPCFTRFSAPHLLQHQQQCPRLLTTLFGTLGAALAAGLGAEAHGDSSILPARGSACAKSQHVGGAGVGQLSRARVPARWGWAFRKTLGHEICDGRDCAVHWHWDFSMCERQVMELCRFSSHQPWDRDLLGGTFLLPLYRF